MKTADTKPTFNPASIPPGSDAAKSFAAAHVGFVPTITPQGDGSYVLRPGKPVSTLTVREAARVLNVHISSVYRLIDSGILLCERPTRGAIRIPLSAMDAHRRHAADPEFWDRQKGNTK
jgi:excisionase family DNA binding protein